MNIFKKVILGVSTFLVLWFAGFIVFALHSLYQSPQKTEHTADAIVVLTGGKNRIEEGLQLFASGRGAHLFITGVHEDVTKKELTARWKGDSALPPCCITLGYKARSTTQNAQETQEWLSGTQYSSIRLVTGNYHMNRSLMEFKHALPDLDIYAHPITPPDMSIYSNTMQRLLLSEYHKMLYRRIILLFTPRVRTPDDN